jgi:REP-associated tyrosine transposase
MPEHFHVLVTEPSEGNVSLVMQVLKQRVARRCLNRADLAGLSAEHAPAFWQTRFYDFNVFTKKKVIEKLRYMHRNPVRRGLVEFPEQWRWSSYRYYFLGEEGPVKIEP